jgi:hypothetical protein
MIRTWMVYALLGLAPAGIAWGDTLQLTDTQPLLRIPVSWEVLKNSPDSIAIEVTGIENPALAPVTLGVYFESKARRWDIGAFTLYPPDHPGIFKFRITSIVASMLQAKQGQETDPIFLCLVLQNAPTTGSQVSHPTPVKLRLTTPRFENVDPPR